MRSLRHIIVAAAAVVVLAAGPAGAHEAPDDSDQPFTARVTSASPEVPGYDLVPLAATAAFEVHAEPGTVVDILGYDGEPYLRIDADGAAFANVNSETYWANESSVDDAPASVGGEPDWQWQVGGGAIEWHDHRIHWMSPDAPVVGDDLVAQTWTVDLVVGGTPVTVNGDLLVNPDVPFENYTERMTDDMHMGGDSTDMDDAMGSDGDMADEMPGGMAEQSAEDTSAPTTLADVADEVAVEDTATSDSSLPIVPIALGAVIVAALIGGALFAMGRDK